MYKKPIKINARWIKLTLSKQIHVFNFLFEALPLFLTAHYVVLNNITLVLYDIDYIYMY